MITFDMLPNRLYKETTIDKIVMVVSCKANCKHCHGKFVSGTNTKTKQEIQCKCLCFEDIGVRLKTILVKND